jgi:sec-independent protein translocase protein TatA
MQGGKMLKLPGVPELIIILIIVLAIFGAGKLSSVGGAVGKAIAGFRKEAGQGQVKKDDEDAPEA